MRLPLALGVAFAALSVAAYAQPRQHDHVVVRHHDGDFNIDANDDGWVTREEASAGADRIFAELDTNDDGRLNAEDRRHFAMYDMDVDVDVDVDGEAAAEEDENTRRVRVIRREHDERGRGERHEEHSENDHVERTVTVVRIGGGGQWEERVEGVAPVPPVPPVAPVPPVPPHPPMFMMIFANSEEADLNGDGALSREEFRAQHMRFFDASDANNDGRVRYTPPPEPPVPPTPPEPPRPPRPPHR